MLELCRLPSPKLEIRLRRCCGAERWIVALARRLRCEPRPGSFEDLLERADGCFAELEREDWLEAFEHHPRIGDLPRQLVGGLRRRFADSADLASSEQAGSLSASETELEELERLNCRYEANFGYIFIVCATGRSAGEMLELLRARIENEPQDEMTYSSRRGVRGP